MTMVIYDTHTKINKKRQVTAVKGNDGTPHFGDDIVYIKNSSALLQHFSPIKHTTRDVNYQSINRFGLVSLFCFI
jgi:hypothetical protein